MEQVVQDIFLGTVSLVQIQSLALLPLLVVGLVLVIKVGHPEQVALEVPVAVGVDKQAVLEAQETHLM